ncbi:MAG TPA: cytochrome P450 [Cyanobacteria bacterium UBA11370]|nr:cytochrome P450 [Cyanobacteria bacterium UBA11370]
MVTITENSPNNTITKFPPGPRVPRFIQTWRGILSPKKYLEKAVLDYGDLYTAQFSGFPTQVVVSNPQAIQEIFTADSKLFESAPTNKILQPIVGDYSVILMDGDRHLHQRRLLMPPFHGERMRTYGNLICNIAEQVISQCQIGQTFTARSVMQNISLRVILGAVFGVNEGERFDQLRTLLTEMLDTFNNPLSSSVLFIKVLQQDLGAWSPWGYFLRKRQEIDQILYAEIRERRSENNSSREDILSLLMSARDEEGQPMTDVELRDELMTLLFAGHETTATALAWSLYWIHHHPEVHEKLLKEIEAIAPTDTTTISQLPYLNAVCSETLRIYPIAWFAFARILKAPLQILNYEFPAGTVLSPCIYLIHHRPDIYPEPDCFKPERFLERQFSPYEYFPFGGGNRRCLGMAFALFEMKLVLTTLLSRYSMALGNNHPVHPVRRGLTFAPSGGVRMVLKGKR